MKFSKSSAAGVGAAALVAIATSAAAQTPPAAPAAAAPAIRHGPAIPGMCYYSFERAFATSEVGKSVIARMDAITKEVSTELNTEGNALDADIQAFDRARPTMTPETAEQRGSQLQLRRNALGRKLDLRQRELQATRAKATDRVEQEMTPLVIQVYQTRNCSMLVTGGVVLANPQMDVTDQVVAALNAKLKTFTFNRERLDTPPAAPAPAAATPPKK